MERRGEKKEKKYRRRKKKGFGIDRFFQHTHKHSCSHHQFMFCGGRERLRGVREREEGEGGGGGGGGLKHLLAFVSRPGHMGNEIGH